MNDYCEACGCNPCDCGWGNYLNLLPKCERCELEFKYCECHWGDKTHKGKIKNAKNKIKKYDKRIRKSPYQTNIT